MIRQPIVILVGHIDHGKSSILERIKGISITKGEAGGITQSIKSYTVPLSTINKVCGDLLKAINLNVKIPGLLFLDSPGHAAFNNMRKRGGNLADIATLVIDINEGIKEQTIECINILKQYKTPFIIALNKIDTLPGWRSNPKIQLVKNISSQSDSVKELIDNKLYDLVGKLSELGFNSERFDRIEDFAKQISIVPTSAKTSEGIPELMMIITGLAQRFLEKELEIEVKGPGKASVLEVVEEKGIGLTLDLILYDGCIKIGDQIVIGSLEKPIITKVRGMFELEKNKLKPVKEVHAAAGIKLVASEIDQVIGGMPLLVANENAESAISQVKSEVEEVIIQTDKEGVVVKADTLGSLEALVKLLKDKGLKIKKSHIGDINKKDIADALAEKEPLNRVILGFNIKPISDGVKIIIHNIIYKIIEDYEKWKEDYSKLLEAKELDKITRPCKIKIIRGCIFRQSNPAVVGIQILGGIINTEARLMRADGSKASRVKNIQSEGKDIKSAEYGKEVAISLPNLVVGRQIKEDDVLFSDLTEEEFMKLKKLKKYFKTHEIEVLKEIANIKRKSDPMWGM
ncbi:MAG: translation initiation factor IF-2 [Nanoarchaeota archaeon]